MWWDSSLRRTISLIAFAAGIMENEEIRSILLLCSEVDLDGTLEDTVLAIVRIINNGKEYLTR